MLNSCVRAQIKDEFMTCANDATLRLWMVEHKGKKTRQIIKCKNKKNGLRTNPTACTYSRDGLLGIQFISVFRIRIRIHRIQMFLGLPDPDPSISKQK